LDVSRNSALGILSIAGNQFTTTALNDLFRSLPYRDRTETFGGTIIISFRSGSGNPGNFDCDRSIALEKGWSFMSTR